MNKQHCAESTHALIEKGNMYLGEGYTNNFFSKIPCNAFGKYNMLRMRLIDVCYVY
jgi:hypothetical protein